jgi:hypothetical protein
MRDKKIIRWIHEDVDGAIGAGDKKKLEAVLKKDPARHLLHQDLKDMNQLLGGIPSLEPAVEARKRILNAIETRSHLHQASSAQKAVSSLRIRTGLKLTYGFIVGVAATVLVMSLIDSRSSPFSVPSGEHIGAIGLNRYLQFPIVEKISVEDESTSGTVLVRRLDRIGGLEIVLHSGELFNVLLTYNDADLVFDMYKPLGSAAVTLQAGKGFVQILDASRDEYLLIFECRKPERVKMQLSLQKKGETSYSHEIVFSLSDKNENE